MVYFSSVNIKLLSLKVKNKNKVFCSMTLWGVFSFLQSLFKGNVFYYSNLMEDSISI